MWFADRRTTISPAATPDGHPFDGDNEAAQAFNR
jgi:hypothetical protein